MEHSITSLAKKARVTIRTLRHYDQIGLLKPSIRMANGKRLYSDEQFMRLFEIVFFKKVGLGLPKIKEIFQANNPNKAASSALIARKEALAKEIKKLRIHQSSIEAALPQYKNCTLNQKEKLEKFNSYLNLVKEIEEMEVKEMGQAAYKRAQEKIESLSVDEVDELTDRSNRLLKLLLKAVEQNLHPGSKEVQEVVQRYCAFLGEFHTLTHEILLKIRDSILDRRECYEAYHPKFPDFLYQAFDAFINETLKNQGK